MSKKSGLDIELAPLRSLDDFLLQGAVFQLPNYRDLGKWAFRVTNNLLYYQTNYFLLGLVMFVIVGIIHPVKVICGGLVMLLSFGTFIYINSEKEYAAQLKVKHPILSLLTIFVTLCIVAYMFQSVLVFSLGILLPVAVTFIHASLRLRNIKNKLANQVEGLGLKKTPMGLFLDEMLYE
ncbi:PRA1 family protein 3 [Sitophilus oryzae]|uniref:PRA1 family protein n=1 Tax=Sitophilus oryzae TaxID=7048 RepID=A0A6J2XY57_SITOR|nr:PRA1 family protein 3 [Sitophilus oryzae]